MCFLTTTADGSNDFLATANSFANSTDRLANVYWKCDVTVHKCSESLFCFIITGKWCLPKRNYLCESSLRQCSSCDKLPVKWMNITWLIQFSGTIDFMEQVSTSLFSELHFMKEAYPFLFGNILILVCLRQHSEYTEDSVYISKKL